MTVQPFDECMYHGEVCHVEQVFDDGEGHKFAVVRPVSELATQGTYFVDQDSLLRVPPQGGVK